MRRAVAALAASAMTASVLAAAAAGGAPAAASPQAREPRRVVVVGVPGLAWRHVSTSFTPRLHELAQTGAVASLSVRAATPVTRRFDGWATLGAGNRARVRSEFLPEVALEPGGRATDPVIEPVQRDNGRLAFDTQLGALGQALHDAGRTTAALGRGAVLGVADSSGHVDVAVLPPPAVKIDAADVREWLPLVAEADVVVVELLDLYAPPDRIGPARLSALDASIGAVVDTLANEDVLIVAGVSGGPEPPPALQAVIVHGPEYASGRLGSASTRRDGFVQLIDIAPTVLHLAGARVPDGVVGQRLRVVGERAVDEIDRLVDHDVAADAHRRYVPQFFALLVVTQLWLYGVAWWALRRRPGSTARRRIRHLVRHAAVAFAAVPVSTYLAQMAPWWRHPLWYLLLVVAAITTGVFLLAVAGPWRRHVLGPTGVVAGVTALVLAVDLVTGARLQMSSLAGYSPVVAGRFAGVGNVAFAVFGSSALLATAALCAGRSRRFCLVASIIVGLITVAVDGNPLWGSDFGGVLSLIPAFALLAMLLAGIRVSARRLVAVGLAAAVVVAAFATADYLRPEDARTHLGRFVEQIVDGDAGTVVRRKAQANLRLLTHSVLTFIVPIAVGFLGFVLLRPWGGLRRAFVSCPPLQSGLVSVFALGVIGFFVNDSGVAVPSLALTVAVPVALAASLHVIESDDVGTSPS